MWVGFIVDYVCLSLISNSSFWLKNMEMLTNSLGVKECGLWNILKWYNWHLRLLVSFLWKIVKPGHRKSEKRLIYKANHKEAATKVIVKKESVKQLLYSTTYSLKLDTVPEIGHLKLNKSHSRRNIVKKHSISTLDSLLIKQFVN